MTFTALWWPILFAERIQLSKRWLVSGNQWPSCCSYCSNKICWLPVTINWSKQRKPIMVWLQQSGLVSLLFMGEVSMLSDAKIYQPKSKICGLMFWCCWSVWNCSVRSYTTIVNWNKVQQPSEIWHTKYYIGYIQLITYNTPYCYCSSSSYKRLNAWNKITVYINLPDMAVTRQNFP